MDYIIVIVLLLILAGEFVNGWNDSPNAIATVISTRVLSPKQAIVMAAILNVAGVLLAGTAVAQTIGKGFIKPEFINMAVVASAVLSVVIWGSIATLYGLPISISHALVAGLTGAGLSAAGPGALLESGWEKVIIGLVISTFMGFFLGLFTMVVLYNLFKHVRASTVRQVFGRLQILSAAFMAFSHGSNDGQKFMGIFTLALLIAGVIPVFEVPLWVIFLLGVVMGLGTLIGGWRVLKTMGFSLTKLEPIHGFAAETSAGLAITMASHLGIPLSTTHTISTAIMGVGATRRFSAVRWGVTRNIVYAWLLTFPICGLLAAGISWLLKIIS